MASTLRGCWHLFKGLVNQCVGRLQFVVAHRAFSRGALCCLVMGFVHHIRISYSRTKTYVRFYLSSGPALTSQTRAYNWRRGRDRSDHPLYEVLYGVI